MLQAATNRIPSGPDVEGLLRSLSREPIPEQLQLGLTKVPGRIYTFSPEPTPGLRLAGWRIVRKSELNVLQVEARMLRDSVATAANLAAEQAIEIRRLQATIRQIRGRRVRFC